MVYIILKSFYPFQKADEVKEIYMEVMKRYPPDKSIAELVIPIAGRATEKGSEGMTVWKLKEGKFDEFVKRLMASMVEFYKVEGFGYRVEVWSTLEESLSKKWNY